MTETELKARALSTLLLCVTLIFAPMTDLGAKPHPHRMAQTKTSIADGRAAPRPLTAQRAGLGPRPSAWCGWWMRSQKGGGPEYNLARNWAKRGQPLAGPEVGAVVVWSHHVGILKGKTEKGKWIVLSGNDGNAVRARARSLDGAIAFRRV